LKRCANPQRSGVRLLVAKFGQRQIVRRVGEGAVAISKAFAMAHQYETAHP
jgi:hypothetical protein